MNDFHDTAEMPDFNRTVAGDCEIIGNIHENADLIKVGGK